MFISRRKVYIMNIKQYYDKFSLIQARKWSPLRQEPGIHKSRGIKGTKTLLWMSNIIDSKKTIDADKDIEFVLACQKGDAEAFGFLVERHQKKMLNIAYRMMEIIMRHVMSRRNRFLRLINPSNILKAEARFSTWLYRIVINYSKESLETTAQYRPT